jgi:hypothetical protein
MPVIPVSRVMDPKRIIGKMEVQGGGEAQGSLTHKKEVPIALHKLNICQKFFVELVHPVNSTRYVLTR